MSHSCYRTLGLAFLYISSINLHTPLKHTELIIRNTHHNTNGVARTLNLINLILYVPSTIFQLNGDGSSWVEPVLSSDKCVLLKDNNTVTSVRARR